MTSHPLPRFLAGSTLLALCTLCLLGAGCRTLQPQSFAAGTPRFEPEKYFAGPTHSWGVLESRAGRPKQRFRTEMRGRRDGDALVITQDFTFDDGRRQQRVWRLRRLDEHRYEATANDVVGVSKGEAFGNAFHWEYTLALRPGNRLANVHFEHWMYLAADGETMLNRVIIRKLGVILTETTEYFQRGAGPT